MQPLLPLRLPAWFQSELFRGACRTLPISLQHAGLLRLWRHCSCADSISLHSRVRSPNAYAFLILLRLGVKLCLRSHCVGYSVRSNRVRQPHKNAAATKHERLTSRRAVLLWAFVPFVFFQLGTGFCKTTAGLLVLRFLAGATGSAPFSAVGAVVADIHGPSTRAVAMVIFSIVSCNTFESLCSCPGQMPFGAFGGFPLCEANL